MKKIFCVLLAVLVIAGIASAHDREGRYVREEASRRGMKLIPQSQVQGIAEKRIGGTVRLKEIELDDEADDYPNGTDFRPVYSLEAVSGGQEYDIELDAVTGEILKFKLDD